jgi:PKD repeat protein
MLSATNSSSASNTYAWSPATGLSNATSASPVFTPTAAGLYVFTLSVTNAFGCQAQTTVIVKVKDVRCGKKNDKVIVCRRAGTSKAEGRCISVADVAEHLRKGGNLGNCEGAGNENPEREPVEPTRRVKLTAYPNPFAKRTTVSFTVSKAERNVTLAIFDALGNRITTLYSGSVEAGATKAFVFDRAQLPAGLYFARLLTATGSKTIKLISSK